MSGTSPERTEFYDRMAPKHLKPLWEVLHGLITPEPKSNVQPAIWRYGEVRPFIMEAGSVITAREAERRVLILENPGLPGQSRITTSLYAGLQLILPGEIAPAHRHTQVALRFVIEGQGAYTGVDGERTVMHEGDFVITPSWTWHDHGNDGDGPMVWLDGLDIPIVTLFDASFAERYSQDTFPTDRPTGDSLARYGAGLMPLGYTEPANRASPVFNYPYARTREALETMRRTEQWDACHGLKLRYVNPANGDYAMPTIGAFMQLLPKGFRTAPYRASDATVFSPVEGTGRVTVGDTVMAFGPRDVFVVPSWQRHVIEASEDVVMFSFSDRPVQQKLGFWREDRGNR